MRCYKGKGARVYYDFDAGFVLTVFGDGSFCFGSHIGNDAASYARTACEAGYQGDVRRMAVENDLLHSWICERAGWDYSPTLWGTAHRRWWPWWGAEEAVVFALQCAIHGGELGEYHLQALSGYIKWVRPKTTIEGLVSEAKAWLAELEAPHVAAAA